MANDEVELGSDESEDYEVVPVGPIRKLERRIDEMEKQGQAGGGGTNDELIHDVLDIMKSNQKIVNDMTESTHELKNSVEDLTHKMDSVIDNMNQFMDLLEEASETDLEGEVINDVHARIADAVGSEMQEVAADIKESNKNVVQNLEELNKSIKRSYTSQNKDQTLSGEGRVVNRGNNQQNSRNARNSKQNKPNLDIDRDNSDQGNPQGGNNRQNQRNNTGGNPGSQKDSDRMERLRKRFNNVEDEE